MDSFKIALLILLAIVVSRIQCVSQNFDSSADTIESTAKLEHQMKKRIRIKTKFPPDYLIPPLKGNYGIFNSLNKNKEIVQTQHTALGKHVEQEKQPILKNSNTDVSQDPIHSGSINQLLFIPNLKHSEHQHQQQEIMDNNEKPTNVFVNQVQENPEESVLKKVPQMQLISEIGSSNFGTSTLSDKDADLLKLIAQIKLATDEEKLEINPKEVENKKVQIGFKIPMPLTTSLLGTAGILKGHLGNDKRNERLLHEPTPFFGTNNYPPGVPLELATQIRLQSDSYGPAFNPLYKEPFPGYLPVKLSPNSQYIEFPIEMYKTKYDPIPVSDNVYINHQLGLGQKAGHIFPVKASQKVFGYTRTARFIGNIINH